jgi:hypothetical protein
MRARAAIAGTSHRVRLTVVGWGLTTMLACVALSACTSSPSTVPVTILSPTVSDGVTVSVTVTATGVTTSASPSTSVSVSSSPSPSASPSPSPSASPSPSPSFSPIPTAAPVTGGGGTAGLQDAALFGIGGAAILLGAGSLAYRRRVNRHR